MINVLVSACLKGEKCRYDGNDNYIKDIDALMDIVNFIPVCPEVDGGLATPRAPSEIKDGRVIAKDGADVTEFFRKGAEKALQTAKEHNCKVALLKAKSPSCGSGKIYDGSFTRVLIDGNGITAQLLKENGIKVFCETEMCEFVGYIQEMSKEVQKW